MSAPFTPLQSTRTRQNMRLLNVRSLEFTDFRDENRPNYVIASHRWVEGREVTLQDVQNRRNTDKSGYKKIVDFANYVQKHVPSVEWLWIDTCCINKDSAAELSKSLNLMFDWYRNAMLCIAYLADVKGPKDNSAFQRSEWFKRGWTLQELLAPRLVIFVTETWQVIGNKGASSSINYVTSGPGLEDDIAAITGIPKRVLYDFVASTSFSVEEKLAWMEGRKTTEPEDMSYALYGIFGVRPGANYGERHTGARQRLLRAIRYQDSLSPQQSDQFRNICSWISSPDPETNHQSARQRHEPHTGTWLLQSAQYQSWKSGSARNLWVHGKAGCGKTVLCSTAIEDVRTYCESATNAVYAMFYFSFMDNQKQSHEHLLRSLAVQVGWKEPGRSILQQAYDKPGRSVPGVDELEKIVLLSAQSYDEVFVVLDALDECPEGESRLNVLECLERLSRKAPKLRIFATSREVSDIGESMEILGAVSMSTETQSVNADIRRYMSGLLSRDRKLRRLDSATKALIEDTISQSADGMFRWAYCQLQELKTLPSTKPKYIKETLRSLPLTLDATYERMLIGIKQMFRQEALILLRWLSYAKSPPSLGELAEAAIINPTAEGYVAVDERGGLEDTLNILSGLAMIQGIDTDNGDGDDDDSDRSEDSGSESSGCNANSVSVIRHSQRISKDTKVRLAHFSVKEYLESKRILQSEAKDFHLESATEHRFLAQSCLTYLQCYSGSSEKSSTNQDLVIFPLLQYAARSWMYHSSLQQLGDVAREVALLRSNDTLRDWLLVYRPDQSWGRPFEPLDDTGLGLYYASFMGLGAVVGELVRSGLDVDAQGGHYGNALQAASARGHEKVVQMLVDARADVNTYGGEFGNALQAASAIGHEKVVQMLVDARADINAQGGKFGNALQAASARGHEKVVQMLVDAGADVNAQGGKYSNALQAASEGSHEKVVEMLLHAGADVNAQGGDYGNALQAASEGNHEKVVEMLLHALADVNARGGHFGNALQAASARGHEKVVQMLMDAGADVNAEGGWFNNALQAASARGHEKVVRMLVNAGADVNAQGGWFDNALQAALARGHEKVVQMLLHAGADSEILLISQRQVLDIRKPAWPTSTD